MLEDAEEAQSLVFVPFYTRGVQCTGKTTLRSNVDFIRKIIGVRSPSGWGIIPERTNHTKMSEEKMSFQGLENTIYIFRRYQSLFKTEWEMEEKMGALSFFRRSWAP